MSNFIHTENYEPVNLDRVETIVISNNDIRFYTSKNEIVWRFDNSQKAKAIYDSILTKKSSEIVWKG